ncbi:hypothetical protein M2451_001497 [Dysgonomonas sp. PFB1-18]|uniref:hypothetical protein n=1 Tax=unclassified Dysgonomonas TaxID=2630389 RepID=UPI002472F83A|nr:MULTISPECIES: hypothetical protein [unclassified Dysgonomonas]MDH6309045.1 hypothetical protein [Dysgonomonas sp. PF1-14]MDH6338796.1 hypothetical protein [Dysgonomonas sp. PF1-16]MDH6380176.1 hypothetical protein [Dysgonomonas sp. PFB1-18]MDH6397506.1 hypothetical protein [Dysgonomonas sp. PF1-23]
MILTITVLSAILLLWILLYPIIKKAYYIFRLGKAQLEKEQKGETDKPKSSETEVSIVGKSNFSLCQPLPTSTTPLAKEPEIAEDDHNFAEESDPAPLDIDYSLDREPNDEIDEEQEVIELKEMFGKDVYYASGLEINDLYKIKYVVESTEVSQIEQQKAGKILYENKETEIVEQLSSGKTASIISELIDLHIALQKKESENSDDLDNIPESDDLGNFDVAKFLNPK